MAFFDDPERHSVQKDKADTPKRKIGYVADRLEPEHTPVQTDTKDTHPPYMITDWASF